MEGHSSPLKQRRALARAIREAPEGFRDRFEAAFEREYGHLYQRSAA